MSYSIFFKEAGQIVRADDFIVQQPPAHRTMLKTLAAELATTGTLTHPQAKRNAHGDWSILLNDNGEVYIYTLYISALERHEEDNQPRTTASKQKSVLVIIDPSGPRDSIGGYHPGYWFVEQYVDFLREEQRLLFMKAVEEIKRGIPSGSYSTNPDGSVSIHIHKEEKTVTISLTCRAEWV